jgi:hypothetical protein
MKLLYPLAALTLLALTSCSTSRNVEIYPRPATASEVAATLPPLTVPVPVSPVDLRTAILTLPADAVAEMSLDGRRNYLVRTPGVFDEKGRRVEFSSDNPHLGIDAKSMFFLRLFEDEKGRTIAASHSARPFADASRQPSAQFTRVYRLEKRKWHDITESALSSGIPKDSFFRFGQRGQKVEFGSYVEEYRADGLGKYFAFGNTERTMEWRNGAFRKN